MSLHHLYYLHETGGKKKQEDYIWPAPGHAGHDSSLFIVCDGVGGSENGEMASRLVAEFVGRAISDHPEQELSQVYITELLKSAQQALISYARANELNGDMATTFSMLALFPEKAFIAWCGDTRVYHLRTGKVLFRTEDHSLVNTLVKNGEITMEEARTHPQRNIILNAIRADGSPVEPESTWISSLQDGDYFLLCTDGLLENVSDNDLQYLSTSEAANTDVVAWLQEKCAGKTRDNYSLYLLQVQVATGQATGGKRHKFLLPALITVLGGAGVLAFVFKKDQPAAAMEISSDSATIRPPVGQPAPAKAVNTDTLPEIEIVSDADTTKTADSSHQKPLN